MSPVSTKPRKKYQPRETDPIKLVMERGLRQKTWTEEDDETGETLTFVKELPPQGAVLDGLQVQAIAMTLARYASQVKVLEGIVEEYQRLLAEEEGEEE